MSTSPMMPIPPQESGSGWKVPALFGIVIALAAANIYLYTQIDQVKNDMSKQREALQTEISGLREASSISNATSRRNLESVKAELEAARHRAEAAAGQAKEDALKHVSELERKVAAEQQKAQAAVKEVKQEVARVEQGAADATKALSENVNKEVSGVRADVASTKSELDKTISDLKKVTGDLGVQSGYIATNTKELSALKALGDRSYFEFKLAKSKQPTRLSDVTLLLKNADLKRNRYTIELVADDKRVEKKDRGVNEPVQFYMSKYRQPCEIVVNEVKKDLIVGYLAQPKVLATRN
ncbi:MAG: hypothetical protein U0Q16_13795 [Bryobacteraceae bacterium]